MIRAALLRLSLLAALALPWAAPAQAQTTCPTFTYGLVLTAAQWQACFDGKQNVLGYTPVNKAGDVMLGRLVTAAPGATTAGLNLTPGSTPSNPSNGDLWTTSVGLFVRIAGTTVGPLAGAGGASFAATSPITVSFPSSVVTYACPTCVTSSGGGAITGVAPVAVSAAGAVSITGAAGTVLAGAAPAFTATPTLGASGTPGSLTFGNATSGLLTIQPVAGALGTVTLSLPAATDTLVGKATTDTFTNKTFDTAGTGNSFAIAGLAVTANTGTGAMARASNPSLANLTVTGSFTATGLVTNAALANPATTVNGQTCTLGSSCTVTAAATTITVGTTLVASGNTTRVLFNNAGTLGEYVITGTGNVVMSASPTLTGTMAAANATFAGTVAVTSSSANALAVGPNGTTNPALQVDASTASSATGLKIKSAAAAGGLAVSVITSGSNENLTIDAAGSGTVTVAGTSTGAITLSRATTLSAALTYGGVTLSNSVTGTGSMVLSASPTLTGTPAIAAATGTSVSVTAALTAYNATAIPAGGTTGSGVKFSSTANYGVFFGSGAPSLSAAQGSLYLRSDGAPYYNNNGSTGWTSLASGSGTVTQIDFTTGLTGGTVTTTGTVAVDVASTANIWAATANKILDAGNVFNAAGALQTLTDAATVAVDFGAGFNFTLTIGGNRTLGNPSNSKVGETGCIYIVQDGTGGRTLAYSSNWKFAGGTAPVLSTAIGAVDRLCYFVRTTSFIDASMTNDIK